MAYFRVRLGMRGYPKDLVDHILSEVKFTERESALQKRQKAQDKPLPFVTQYHPSVPHLKKLLMGKWHWIENQHHHEKWELCLVCQHPFHLSMFKGERN